ncbi:MAG TPA: HDIG domain-containing protein, partial [Candidatus Absconditabacterales bacterium]|nr:HDIG domain-containing protein [Candidatus Absconditabacterales bacterium]
ISGVEVLIDDTPLIVKLSSYDPEKRYIATETLKRLVKDGRINPVYIEKTYTEVLNSIEDLLIEKGKEALQMLNLPMMKPDVMRMIGQFHLRYSYGQNLWIHSIEVARIAESLAVEMGLDGLLAKRAGLLHDIGKVVAANGQSHTKIGAEVLRKYGFDDVIVNTAEAHHYDVPITHPIGWIVTAADALSAGRPGARFNTKAIFVEKMSELEKLISGVPGVDKVHIMQAGREIMIFVNPSEVDDLGVEKLIKEVAVRVEDQLDYPGIIRVVAIRETKVIDYLR